MILLILWAGIIPAVACGGSAWVCGAPLHMIGVLAATGLLSGWVGAWIAASAYKKLINLRDADWKASP